MKGVPVTSLSNADEKGYFDDLVQETEATWWGDRTPAAQVREQTRIALLRRTLNPPSGSLFLEVGCGVGNFSFKLAEQFPGCHFVCIDLSEDAISIARKKHRRPNIEYLVGDCGNLPPHLVGRQMDYVVGRSILHHLPDLPGALRGFYEALRQGGRLFFSEPNPLNPHTFLVSRFSYLQRLDQWSRSERPVSAVRLRQILEYEGLFSCVSIEPYDFVHPAFPLVMARLVDRMNCLLSGVPLIRYLAGSLIISAEKNPERTISGETF